MLDYEFTQLVNRLGPKRGIGPTYADKARRIGVRMADMRDPRSFDEVLRRRIKMANAEMERGDLNEIPALWQDLSLIHI